MVWYESVEGNGGGEVIEIYGLDATAWRRFDNRDSE